MAPTVSAIITTHNRLNLLLRAIDSVRKQTYPNLEIIVVDDASSDGTRERLANETGLQYIYITPLESKGSNHARNIGLENAHGEYIAFLDDDDYWLPEKTQKQINLIE